MTKLPQEFQAEEKSIIDFFEEQAWAGGKAEGREEGLVEGRAEGWTEGIQHSVIQLHQKGFTPEEIADLLSLPLEKVREALG